MRIVSDIRNRLKRVYSEHPALLGYAFRFVLTFLALLIISSNIGFNEILSNFLFVLLFSAACSFIPVKFMLFAIAAYSTVQLFSLSAGPGVIAGIIFVIMYLIYFRFDEKTGYAIILIPILCIIRLPILIPLLLAVTSPMASVVSVILGYVAYYFMHYLKMNAAVFQGVVEGGEITKMSMAVSGLFSYRDMWFMMSCAVIAFLVTYFVKKININMSHRVAIAVGGGVFLVLAVISNLIIGNITASRLIWHVAGTALSVLIAVLLSGILLPLDYKRTELFEFEDDEYKYYVRAVPKAQMIQESVKIKRIYSRKHSSQEDEKGDEH